MKGAVSAVFLNGFVERNYISLPVYCVIIDGLTIVTAEPER